MHPDQLQPVERLYARAITASPNFVRAMHGMSLMYLSVGRFREALEFSHMASQCDAERPEPIRTIARLFADVFDRPHDALLYALGARNLDPTHLETVRRVTCCARLMRAVRADCDAAG